MGKHETEKIEMATIAKKCHLNWQYMSSGFANNKGTYQPAHPRSLVSAFVIRVLEKAYYYLDLLQAKFQRIF